MCPTIRPILLAVLAAGPLAAAVAQDAPPRAASGQTLVVPDAQLDAGEVFHIVPGDDAQIVVTSDAPLQRTVASCRRAVGYFLRPYDAAPDQPPIVAGAIRIPLASLDCGARTSNEIMRSAALLSVAEHPEATFVLRGVEDVRLQGAEGEARSWSVTLRGALALAGKSLDLKVPATLRIHPFTFRTMNRTPGDLLTVRAEFDLTLDALGLSAPDRALIDRIADHVKVSVFLLASVAPPDHSYDPRIARDEFHELLNFVTYIRDFNDPQKGYALGGDLLRARAGNSALLNELALAVINEDGIETRDLDFALRAASRACELSADDDAMLATRAQVHFKRGEPSLAVAWQEKALAAMRDAPPPALEPHQRMLEQYRTAARRSPTSAPAAP